MAIDAEAQWVLPPQPDFVQTLSYDMEDDVRLVLC